MSKFAAFVKLELKRFVNKRNIIIFLLILLLSLYYVNKGIDNHKRTLEISKEFQDVESILFEALLNYAQYSSHGINLLFIPDIAEIFFTNTGKVSELTAKIDSVTTLNIRNDCKSVFLFKEKYLVPMDFSGMMLLIFSLLTLFYGYDSLRDKGYLKFLTSLTSHKKVFFFVIAARFILIAFSFIFIFVSMFILFPLKNVSIPAYVLVNLSGYLLAALLMMLFFFLAGVTIGNIRSKTAGVTAIIFAWLIFLFLIPGALNTFITEGAENMTSNYKTELDKLNIASGFEKRMEKQLGEYSKDKVVDFRQIWEEFFNTEYKMVEETEENHKRKLIENIERYNRLSIFTPTTFYYLACGETSSRGYGNFIRFYTYLQDLKYKFARFWIDRVYFNNPKDMVNFVKGDENLFHGTSHLPGNFGMGVIINFAYILLLMVISYFHFKTYLYRPEVKRTVKEKNLPIILSKGDLVVMILYHGNHGYNDHLFNILAGHTNIYNEDLKIEIDSVDLTGNQIKQDFLYLCHPDKLPQDIKAIDFIVFVLKFVKPGKKEKGKILEALKTEPFKSKTWDQLESVDKGRVFLSVLPFFKHNIFLLDDVAFDMPVDYIFELNEVMKKWAESGAAVIYLTTESEVNVKRYKASLDRDVDKLEGWSSMVSELKKLTN